MAIRLYKVTGPRGIAFYDGTTRYRVGERLAVENPDEPNVGSCGRGLHASVRLQDAVQFARIDLRRCEFFALEVEESDVLARDSVKVRVRAVSVVLKLRESDFGMRRGRLDQVLRYGDGYGSGYGSGDGDGYGYCSGSGYGSGDGDGYGSGSGDGYG